MNNLRGITGGLVFVHDHKFRKIEEKIYSTGGLSDDALQRYVKIFGEVTVIARIVEEKSSDDKYSEIKNKHVKIIDGSKLSKKNFEFIIGNSDYVISRMPSYLGYKAIKFAQKKRKKYLIEVVACVWDALWNHSVKGKLFALPSYIVMKKEVRDAKYVLYVTAEFLQSRYPTKGKTVSCSNVVLRDFENQQLDIRLEKIKKRSTHKIILGTTAALDVRYKGQQYVIEAIGKLKEEGLTNFEYQLVGGGDKSYLESIAKKFNVVNEVKFIGVLPHKDIFNFLEKIDIYIQPSRQEGLPRGLIEAMSMALPSIGARTAGIPELLESKFIFSNSKKNIYEICNILKDLDKEMELKQAVRNYTASKEFDKTIIEKRREKFFIEFLEEK